MLIVQTRSDRICTVLYRETSARVLRMYRIKHLLYRQILEVTAAHDEFGHDKEIRPEATVLIERVEKKKHSCTEGLDNSVFLCVCVLN